MILKLLIQLDNGVTEGGAYEIGKEIAHHIMREYEEDAMNVTCHLIRQEEKEEEDTNG